MILAVALAQPEPEDLNVDFRGGRLPLNDLHLFGPNAKKYVEPEEEGLRITVPASAVRVGGTGGGERGLVPLDWRMSQNSSQGSANRCKMSGGRKAERKGKQNAG